MTSEIRSNKIKNRAGLGTVTFSDTGAVLSGIVTANDLRTDEIRSQSGLGTITVSNTGAVFSGILTATKFVGDGTGLTGNLSYSGNYLGMTDTPSSYTAGAFHRSNNAGNAMQNSATLFEDDQGRIGIGENSPGSKLHVKQNSDATYITIESGGNNIPYWVGVTGGASNSFYIENGNTFNKIIDSNSSDYVFLYGGGQQRIETTNTGVSISGVLDATGDIQLSDKIYHSGDTNTAIRFPLNDTITFETAGTERLRVDSSGNATFVGNISAVDGTFTGDVSIGGTLTYEDVTNIDSIGIITARSDIKVGTAITLTSAGAGFYAGIVTASDFVKRDGTSLGFSPDAQNNLIAGTNAGNSLDGSSAEYNILIGHNAGRDVDNDDDNIMIGREAGLTNKGNQNVFIGWEAAKSLHSNANGVSSQSIIIGAQSALSKGKANGAVIIGCQSAKDVHGNSGTSSIGAVYVGYEAGGGSYNACTFVGYAAGSRTSSSCYYSTGVGSRALNNDSKRGNTGTGYNVGYYLEGGQYNTLSGFQAGYGFNSGVNAYHDCVAIGSSTGKTMRSNMNTILIGAGAEPTSDSVSNEVTIGNTNVNHLRIPGIGVSFSEGGAVFSGIVTATNFAKADGTSLGGVASDSNSNTLGGTGAGLNLQATGEKNTYFGREAGEANNTGDYNIAFGAFALKNNNTGNNNVALGYVAQYNATGSDGIAIGTRALYQGSGAHNIAIGYYSGDAMTTGHENILIGYETGGSLTDGSHNTVIGHDAFKLATDAKWNIAIGKDCMNQDDPGDSNVGVGYQTLMFLTGQGNTAVGESAIRNATTCGSNTAVGKHAMYETTTGGSNVAIGIDALRAAGEHEDNVCIGAFSGKEITTGDKNVTIGRDAGNVMGYYLTTGSNNILIGHDASPTASGVNNEVTIGDANIDKFRIPGINFVLKDNGGTPTQGHVLTVDANGEASFAAASGGGGAGTGEAFVILRNSSNPPALSNTGRNIIIGVQAADKYGNGNATGGNENLFMGYAAGYTQTSGDGNVFLGAVAGYSNSTAGGNTYVGHEAGRFATGANNVIVGRYAGDIGGFTGSNNIVIGASADPSSAGISNEITLGDANITNFRVPGVHIGITANAASLPAAIFRPGVIQETYHNYTSNITGNYTHDILSYGMVWNGTANASGAWTFNIRGDASTTFNSLTSTGKVTTMTMYSKNSSTGNYMTAFKIDGTTQTVKWAGGSAPSAATGSGVDVYSMTIMKTGSNTYHVFGNVTNFA